MNNVLKDHDKLLILDGFGKLSILTVENFIKRFRGYSNYLVSSKKLNESISEDEFFNIRINKFYCSSFSPFVQSYAYYRKRQEVENFLRKVMVRLVGSGRVVTFNDLWLYCLQKGIDYKPYSFRYYSGFKRRGYRYYRHPKTQNERKQNVVVDEGEPPIRGRRLHLPSAWDDICRKNEHNWKKQCKVKKQWMKRLK